MLSRLSIKNVALIESADIEFGEGLNVLSGETGAGKSVILDSVNFVLGAKAPGFLSLMVSFPVINFKGLNHGFPTYDRKKST